ncbi:hypothetical protein [Zhongshania borealis]|uniref:Lipoprotein n=1 Tax=Zhongshania borealis TaxID=889488 RepID=A0ABP7WX13_9GAMM
MKTVIFAMVVTIAFSTMGCATSPPTFGDRIKADGESTVAIAKQWEEGQSLVKKGEKQVKEGHKTVENGRLDLRNGEQLIITGNIAVETSRQSFQALAKITQDTADVDTAVERAHKLKKYAAAWEEGKDNTEKGRELIKRGNNRVSEGESNITKGHKLIEVGRVTMQGAESSYRP